MQKTILITGSTDGIGLEAAKSLVSQGHRVLIHGRSKDKLALAEQTLRSLSDEAEVQTYLADFSRLEDVVAMAKEVTEQHDKLDVLINNAGVFKVSEPATSCGIDVRFVVNTLSPYLMTNIVLPLCNTCSRVINLSSAAQAPVELDALQGITTPTDDFNVYAQSKLALTMWSHALALKYANKGPVFIAVNPGSLLATKMVKEGFGMDGKDITIGANILTGLALDTQYANATGQYFDNDLGRFAPPHPDAINASACEELVQAIDNMLKGKFESIQ